METVNLKLSTPTVHLNGTGRDALVKQARDAYRAVESALDALYQAAPHGRDYYPQGPGALAEAEAMHRRWRAHLAEVSEGLMALAMRINEAGR